MPLSFKNFLDKKSQEKFFCLEVSSSFLRGTLLATSGQQIEVLDSWLDVFESSQEEKLSKIDPELIKNFLSDIKIPSGTKIIILGNSPFIYTVPAWIRVSRESKEEIEEAELENLISQAVWKFLNIYRPQAIEALKISETDILLADIRNLRVKINNHKVLNPIGFKAKTIEFLIEETFVDRDYFRAIEDVLPIKSAPAFISQLGVVDSQVIFRSLNFEEPFSLIRFYPGNVSIINSESKNKFKGDISESIIKLQGEISWDKDVFISRLSEKLKIDHQSASQIMDAFHSGEVSSKIHKFIKDSISLEWEDFLNKIAKKTSSKQNYIIEDKELPNFVYRRKEKPKLIQPDIAKTYKKLGFEVDNTQPDLFSAISGFIEYYFSFRDDRLNKLARRRAKWLIP